jgi:formylglycine-generating enzyme required for sulfatase activity
MNAKLIFALLLACFYAAPGSSQTADSLADDPVVTTNLVQTTTNLILVGTNQTTSDAIANEQEPAVQVAPDIKELIKGDRFTNYTGMVMVKISPTLWAGQYLVTQAAYQTVVGSNPSRFSGPNNPVDSVSWNDAMSFCVRLTELEEKQNMLPEGMAYTLPTQAQWESLMAGAPLSQAVTSEKTRRTGTAPVGSLGANRLGLYDVRGNLWQWTLDPQDKAYRVLRGGAWDAWIEINLRPEFRWYSNGPDDRKEIYGFRCVLTVSGR